MKNEKSFTLQCNKCGETITISHRVTLDKIRICGSVDFDTTKTANCKCGNKVEFK